MPSQGAGRTIWHRRMRLAKWAMFSWLVFVSVVNAVMLVVVEHDCFPEVQLEKLILASTFGSAVALITVLVVLNWLVGRLERAKLRQACGASVNSDLPIPSSPMVQAWGYLPMKWIRANDKLKAVLLVLAIGTLCSTGFYLYGLHVWALIGLAFIPFAFGCWALSVLLSGSRNRELYANMTANEREQLIKMAKAYGRRAGILFLPPGLVLIHLAVLGAILAHPQGPKGAFDYLIQHQVQLAVGGLVLIVAVVLIVRRLPAMVKQRRAMREFLLQTEYAKRKGYCPR